MKKILLLLLVTTLMVCKGETPPVDQKKEAENTAKSDSTELTIANPYVRLLPPGTKNTAAFMKISNPGSTDTQLVRAQSDICETVELHTHTKVDGKMQMRQVENIPIAAGQTVSLQPGGLHVMLIGLKKDLSLKQMVTIQLIFANGQKKTIQAEVKEVQPPRM